MFVCKENTYERMSSGQKSLSGKTYAAMAKHYKGHCHFVHIKRGILPVCQCQTNCWGTHRLRDHELDKEKPNKMPKLLRYFAMLFIPSLALRHWHLYIFSSIVL